MNFTPFLGPLFSSFFILAPLFTIAFLDLRSIRLVLLATRLWVKHNLPSFLILLLRISFYAPVPLLLPSLVLVDADLHGPTLLVFSSGRFEPFTVKIAALVLGLLKFLFFGILSGVVPSVTATKVVALSFKVNLTCSYVLYSLVFKVPLQELLISLNEFTKTADNSFITILGLINIVQESALVITNNTYGFENAQIQFLPKMFEGTLSKTIVEHLFFLESAISTLIPFLGILIVSIVSILR